MTTTAHGCAFRLLPVLGPIVGAVRQYSSTVPVLTWEDDPLASPRLTKPGTRGLVDRLVVHETCDDVGAADTLATLRKRKLTVHMINDAHGQVTQHADLLTDIAQHAQELNGRSIGVECDNPYYPTWNRSRDVWTDVIDAPWAHALPNTARRYVVPTLETAESMAALIEYLTTASLPGIQIPRRWVGLKNGRLSFSQAPHATGPGIYAHQYTGHADGAWLVLYAYLRVECGFAPADARAEAVRLATGASGSVAVPGPTS